MDQSLIEAILSNPIERVLILLLCLAVFLLWRKLTQMQDRYADLLRETIGVLEMVPEKLDSTWKEAVATLKLHVTELFSNMKK